jgi:putative ABC transport system permease protein
MADWRFWHWRKTQDDEMDRELEVHFTLEIEEQLEAGKSLKDARLAAHRTFGSVALTKEELRDMRTGAALERLWQDVRYALRLMRRSPGFTVVAMLTLTLAIAANSAVFSVVEGVILRPLSYRDSAQLVAIGQVNRSVTPPAVPVCAAHFAEWRRSSTSFDGLSLLEATSFTFGISGEPERVSGAGVSANLFSMLGVPMQLGRTFLEEEDAPGRDHVIILSDELWRRRFAADPHVIGQSIRADDIPYEIVGVLPREFRFPLLSQVYAKVIFAQRERPQVWKPIALPPQLLEPRTVFFNYAAIGRLKPSVTAAQALSELNVFQSNLAKLSPSGTQYPVTIVRLQEQITGNYRAGLVLIWAAVGAVLLISCVNVANLLLARAARRRREMAVRSALGASRGRIARQMFVESLVLAVTSGVVGLAGAYGLVRLIVAAAPGDLPRLDEVHVDGRVLLFTVAIALIDGVLFGVLPAWRTSQADPQEALRSDSRTSSVGREVVRLRGLLVSIEVAVCVLCLIVGGLLLRSFAHVLNVHRGFDGDNVVTVEVNLPRTRYPTPLKRSNFFRSVLERAPSLPGVASVGLSNLLPMSGGTGPGNTFVVDEFPVPSSERPSARIRVINGEFFRAMGIPLRHGRTFRDDDNGRVAIVSNLTAMRAWSSDQVVGKQLRLGSETGPAVDIVGVVGDIRATSLTADPTLEIYLPHWTTALPGSFPMSLALKSNDAVGTSRLVRSLLHELDPELAVPASRTMDEIVWGSLGQRRFQLSIVLLFAATGLLLATIGIYGVVSYSVAQRTGEIGIRMALGADTTAIHSLVIRQALFPLVPGLVAGVVASLGIQQLIATLVFDVSPRDPLTIVAVCVLLTAVATGAAYIPSRRATRGNPVTALRYE